MHYTEIEMAESMSTQTKISARRFLPAIFVVLVRVAICFEYPARAAYLKICIQKFLKPVVFKNFSVM